MPKLNNVDYSKLRFDDTGLVIYDGKVDPAFDSPLASISGDEGFCLNKGKIELTFDNNQHIYDLMDTFVKELHAKTDGSVKIPVIMHGDLCTVTFTYSGERVPLYMTTTDKGSSRCYLNVQTELKEYLTIGWGFKIQFKLHYGISDIHFILESIQIPDVFNGDKDYLESGNADTSDDEACYSNIDSDMYISDIDEVDSPETDHSLENDEYAVDLEESVPSSEKPIEKLTDYAKNPMFAKYAAELKELENVDVLDEELIDYDTKVSQ
jgi:hypothetical protein